MKRLPRGPVSLITAGIAALVAAAPAAAIGFGAPVTVSPPGVEPDFPAAAVNASGDLAVAWYVWPRFSAVAYRSRGGSFERPQRLRGHRPAGLEVTASGETIVALTGRADMAPGGGAYVAVRPPGLGKRFGRPVDVSRGQEASDIALDAAPNGEAVVTWASSTGIWATIRSTNGSWSAPVRLSGPAGSAWFAGPRVAVLPSGAALVAWQASSRVEAAVRAAGGSFGPAVTVAQARRLEDLEGAGGRWGILVRDDDHRELLERPEVGAFAAPVPIPGSFARYGGAELALAPDGAASVLKSVLLPASADCFGTTFEDEHALVTTSRPAGGTFGPDHLLTPAGQPGSQPSAAIAGGRELFIWDQPRRTELFTAAGDSADEMLCAYFGTRPFAAAGAAGADPGQPAAAVEQETAPGFHTHPALASDPAGPAAVAWVYTAERIGNERVRVALVGGGSLGRNPFPDIVSPRLRGLTLAPRRVRPGGLLTLRFRLSERAGLRIRLLRPKIGKPTKLIRTIRVKRPRGRSTVTLGAPGRGRYVLELEGRDRGGNPVYGGPFDLKFRVR